MSPKVRKQARGSEPALLAEKRDGSRKAYHTTGLGASQLWTKRLDSGPFPGLTVELAGLDPEYGSLCK
ncbi:hypothetical protein WJX77_011752 [Trebouxia sp. C0004]